MNISGLEERFRRDPLATRLGNLAANLARISSAGRAAQGWPVVLHHIRESKYFVEWMAPELPQVFWEFLVGLQVQLSLIELHGLDQWTEGSSDVLRLKIREWSDALVQVVLSMRVDPGYVPATLPDVFDARNHPASSSP